MSEHIIAQDDDGIRLDRWFKRHRADVNHAMLEKALRKGDVRLDGKKSKASDRITAGQVLSVKEAGIRGQGLEVKDHKPKADPRPLNPADIAMMQAAVLYKDKHVIVINKPAGLAVQGGTGISKSVDGLLDALRFDALARPKLVHRLDKDTSGVLVLARDAKAATELMQAFSGKTAQKIYWALVKGAPEKSQGKIDLPLAKQEEGDVEKVAVDTEEGKRAVTHYRVLDRLSRTLAFVELMPVTGRTHQLRVHMAAIGHPIIGDGKYGGKEAFVEGMGGVSGKLHLHARRLMIPGVIDVTAPLPAHMKKSFDTLGIEYR